MMTFMNSKLQYDWQIIDKKNYIFQKIKSYEISTTNIYIGEDLEFIIHVFYWCIPSDHKIFTKCKKKHRTWLKLYLVIISALELKSNKQKKNKTFSTKIFWFFSEFFCCISSSYFRIFTFMCVLIDKPNERCKKAKKIWKKCVIHPTKTF